MNLGAIRQLLEAGGIRLTRSLGQNFLHDGNQIRRIVDLAQLSPNQHVLEIGPGLGPLTEGLLAAGARVLAIEKDRRLVEVLRQRLGTSPSLEIQHDDALDWLTRSRPDLDEWQVVANLPYSVGSPILVELAHLPRPPLSMTVTLQAEVVDRIRARPGTGDFGILTLLLARAFTVDSAFPIPATCFFPVPNVASACVRLIRRPHPLTESADAGAAYVRLVKLSFSQRRKRLRKVLRTAWPDPRIGTVWTALGLSEDTRAETLAPEVFARMAECLGPPAS